MLAKTEENIMNRLLKKSSSFTLVVPFPVLIIVADISTAIYLDSAKSSGSSEFQNRYELANYSKQGVIPEAWKGCWIAQIGRSINKND